MRVAIILSHPIQHFCPQFASFATNPNLKLKVFFGSSLGFKKYHDLNFNREIAWADLYLEEFDHLFLDNGEGIPSDKHLDAKNLESELEMFKPDVVIVYGYFQKIQRRAYRWAKRTNTLLAYISDSERYQHRNIFKEILKFPYLYNYFSKIDLFLSVGEANEYYYKFYGVPEGKLRRMPFPIDIRSYKKAFERKNELKDKLKSELNISATSVTLTIVGKLVDYKGHINLIKALHRLESTSQTLFELIIVGSGPMMQHLQDLSKQLKKNKIHFAGFVTPADLPQYYAACDIYIHPSRIDAHSLSISEAIYMGCPVIVSDRCGSYGEKDDVRPGYNGFVVKYGDINELAERIDCLAQRRDLLEKFSLRSHEIAEDMQLTSHNFPIQALNKLLKVQNVVS